STLPRAPTKLSVQDRKSSSSPSSSLTLQATSTSQAEIAKPKDPSRSSPEQTAIVTDIHDSAPALPVLRASQQDIIEAINHRRRERELALSKKPNSSPNTPPPGRTGSVWLGSRPVEGHALDRGHLSGLLRLPTSPSSPNTISPISMPVSVQVTSNNSGFKIRIPRDLPNLPEVFRKRGAIRTLPISIGSSQGTIKRTHSQMMLDDPNGLEADPRTKIAKGPPIPSHLANVKNLAIRTSPNPIPSPSPSSLSTSDSKKQPLSSVPQRHRSDSKSKSSSPVPTPVRFPTPPSNTSRSESGSTFIVPSHSHGTRSAAETTVQGAEGVPSGSTLEATSPASTSSVMDVDPMELKPLELVRVGMSILDRLVSNTYCRSFINKVPQSAATYHVVIKKPMDLTTIEHKLWRTLELASNSTTISR
ncbi:hypothetical protein BGZ52_005776, partial [Haplosporangium bisporale]